MKLFLRQLTLFLLVQLFIWSALLWVYARHRPFGKLYLAATMDKDRLLAEQSPPRLILVGGSNLPFGIDSAKLESELGYHPVNLGLHVSLGLDFILKQAEPGLRAGDLLIVSPEYELFGAKHYSGEGEILFDALEQRPANIKYFSPGNLLPLLNHGYALASDILDYDLRCLAGAPDPSRLQDPTNVYKRSSFNRYGDVVAHRSLPPKNIEVPRIAAEVSPGSIRRTIDRLNRFADLCGQKGVRIFYSYPTVSEPYFESNRKTIEEVATALNRDLKFPQIDTPEEHHLPASDFFDTYYHLNANGIETRTNHLIESLREKNNGPALAPE